MINVLEKSLCLLFMTKVLDYGFQMQIKTKTRNSWHYYFFPSLSLGWKISSQISTTKGKFHRTKTSNKKLRVINYCVAIEIIKKIYNAVVKIFLTSSLGKLLWFRPRGRGSNFNGGDYFSGKIFQSLEQKCGKL